MLYQLCSVCIMSKSLLFSFIVFQKHTKSHFLIVCFDKKSKLVKLSLYYCLIKSPRQKPRIMINVHTINTFVINDQILTKFPKQFNINIKPYYHKTSAKKFSNRMP